MRVKLVISSLLVVGTCLLFWQVGSHGFINYDDNVFVTENDSVRAGISLAGARWALTSTVGGCWHPLTWLSHMLDWELSGPNPAGHHLTSMGLHAANGVLLFLLLVRLTAAIPQSAFVAALFLFHPLHVESVAWVAERKDVLSGFFWMLTLLAYGAYASRPRIAPYLLTLLLFLFGLMAKPMLVTLPFVMLLLDFWPLNRLGRAAAGRRGIGPIVLEKVPFLLAAAAVSLVTVVAQRGAHAYNGVMPFSDRVSNALVSYARYAGRFFWPHDLAILYPFPHGIPPWQGLGAAVLLAAVTVAALRLARRQPFFLVGWLWFLGTLVPVIGLVKVGEQAMADRYTYLPLIGLGVIVAWGVPRVLPAARWSRAVLVVAAVSSLAVLMVLTGRQLGYWHDDVALYRHTLEVTEDNPTIQLNLGVALARRGRLDEAIRHYREAVRIDSGAFDTHYSLGNALLDQGRAAEAVGSFRNALRLNPQHVGSHNNLAVALEQLGNYAEAAGHYREALQADPGNVVAATNLRDCLGHLNR